MSKLKLCVPFQYNNEIINLVQRDQEHIQIAERYQVSRVSLMQNNRQRHSCVQKATAENDHGAAFGCSEREPGNG